MWSSGLCALGRPARDGGLARLAGHALRPRRELSQPDDSPEPQTGEITMIDLKANDVVLSFWAADVPDFFACVWRSPGDPSETWRFQWRIRHHVDGKVFDSDDEKRWYGGTVRGAADTIRHALNEAGAAAQMQGYREIPINGFFDDAAFDTLTAE